MAGKESTIDFQVLMSRPKNGFSLKTKPSPPLPNLDLEYAVVESSGTTMIAGIDEAGRGSIAGPVFAAAVILPLNKPAKIAALGYVNDSKKMTARQRVQAYDLIMENALAFGVGSTPASTIDSEGIIPANAQAMMKAVAMLDPEAQYLLIDGRMRLRNLPLPQESIIRGDSKSLSIAAASILAKVSRDRYMISLAQRFPAYGLDHNMGYCTAEHVAALDIHGPCPEHRHSFSPIRLSLL
jgi:ribonuclease HII